MSRKRLVMFFVGLGLAILLITMVTKAHVVTVKHYEVAIEELPPAFDGLRVLHVTDLHSKKYGDKQKGLADLLGKEEYDLVAVTGDIVDMRNRSLEPATKFIELLGDKPVFFVPGNHEVKTGIEFREKLDELEVTRLENRALKFQYGGQHIWLVGVNDPHEDWDKLVDALSEVIDGSPRVLLAHSPTIFEQAVEQEIDLVLAGHTHGGQIRLPFLGVLFISGQGLFPRYVYGEYMEGKTTMIVNSGIGETVFNIRLETKPEVVIVTLRPIS
ncbi:metallophosphoesterase [Dethiobacter alkaliphilus]|uniref:metallophosphoesterase n=1 Tax=Dethiobacter alkaliphilus TaxID=427926 RepID=UPI002227F9FF|nr:metallophosphoesterase [Dethiobacter alkaliphilus]MCW3490032.1 metallophosphoesterase [Dethiobacter alkaliphilus]